MKQLKVGSQVSPCYDGKASRDCAGTVISVRAQSVRVEFVPYTDENPVKLWFRRTWRYGCIGYQAYLQTDDSIMRGLFGLRGDYYCFYIKSRSNQ